MTAWRYRRCPRYRRIYPGGELRPVRYGSHWQAGGYSLRRCPRCGYRGQTRDFQIVKGAGRGRQCKPGPTVPQIQNNAVG